MSGGFALGDVEIQSFLVDGSVDLRYKTASFDVYQDVKKPYHSVVIDVIDDGDTLNNVIQFNGGNTFDLSFSQPGQEPYKNSFVLTNVEKQVTLQNQRVARYNITGYSTHMVNFPKIQKAYKNQTGTDIIQDLFSYLGASKGLVINDPSQGMFGTDKMPFNINGLSIYKALRTAMLRCKSSSNDSSCYTFFENNTNMVIDTLENMINNVSPVGTYFQKPLGKDFLQDNAEGQYNILNYREEAVVDGGATTQSTDMQTQSMDNFSQNLQKSTTGSGVAATFLNIVYDTMRPPTFMNTVVPARKSFAAKMDAQALTILVYLNPALTVGAGFTVDTLSPPGSTDIETQDTVSGTYLITESRHSVKLIDQRKPQGLTSARGVNQNVAQSS